MIIYQQQKQSVRTAFAFLVLVLLLSWTKTAKAGWLVSAGPSANIFSLRSLSFEKTPNYYGLGFNLQAGFSFRQIIDVSTYSSYVPGTTGRAIIGEEEAQFMFYGGQIGIRIEEQAYFALLIGTPSYRLISFTDQAVKGYWLGQGGGMRIGTMYEIEKERSFQLSFDYIFADLLLQNTKIAPKPRRQMDLMSFSLNYTFNSFIPKSRYRSILNQIF